MCFEFEALYWAKLAEEEEKRKEAEKQRKAAETKPQRQPAYDEDLLPV
ncbi:MAG: hypothetical protein HY067_09350 [Betaproteobacteria bacterium]|nr:hypothetical protein [Betaproteobacteria bacterium]